MKESHAALLAGLLAFGASSVHCGPESAAEQPLICDCPELFGHASGADSLGPLICSSPGVPVERDLTLVVESCFCATQQCTDLQAEVPASPADLSVVAVAAKDGSPLGNDTLSENSGFVVRIRYTPTALTSGSVEGERRFINVTGTCTYQSSAGNHVPLRVMSIAAGSCPGE